MSLYPDSFQVVLSDPIWLDKENDIYGIEDFPITAINSDITNEEIRLFSQENISEKFPDIPIFITESIMEGNK